MTKSRKSNSAAPRKRTPATPVKLRQRHDGWSPEKQLAFLDALAASGCVSEACASVGMSKTSAYVLRSRVDAQGFRTAWAAALDQAIARLSDECFSRAMHGEVVPHFYRGEQVGEHRRYDNKLAMFLMRYRDPLRYAASLDQMVFTGHPEQAALAFARARDRAAEEAYGVAGDSACLDPDATAPAFVPIRREEALAQQRAVLAREAADARDREEMGPLPEPVPGMPWTEADALVAQAFSPPAMASTSSTSAGAAKAEWAWRPRVEPRVRF